jgi:uncharacterized Rmd1/YagE family protein
MHMYSITDYHTNVTPTLAADDRFQAEYDKSIKYLDVDARINLLNRRLEVLKDLNSILMDAAHNQHASILEWIVIVLIIAEVAIEIFRGWRELM